MNFEVVAVEFLRAAKIETQRFFYKDWSDSRNPQTLLWRGVSAEIWKDRIIYRDNCRAVEVIHYPLTLPRTDVVCVVKHELTRFFEIIKNRLVISGLNPCECASPNNQRPVGTLCAQIIKILSKEQPLRGVYPIAYVARACPYEARYFLSLMREVYRDSWMRKAE